MAAAGRAREGVQGADPDLVAVVSQQLHGPGEPLVGNPVPVQLRTSALQLVPFPLMICCRCSSTRRRRSLSHRAYNATTDPAASPPVRSASAPVVRGSKKRSAALTPTRATTATAMVATNPNFRSRMRGILPWH
ncbi:hypothetical protein GCM10011581_47660 [Saccharopolyspora subtropica]|uniref:Uncharacterized protein n=1 Tax=Saccharopolyspora thermophila TaxID=89367 RepID=A0A917KBK8_9PSEU|nr:hypothetical protein GCM10011581_47660 [Saccharopolyspora subtropica]